MSLCLERAYSRASTRTIGKMNTPRRIPHAFTRLLKSSPSIWCRKLLNHTGLQAQYQYMTFLVVAWERGEVNIYVATHI